MYTLISLANSTSIDKVVKKKKSGHRSGHGSHLQFPGAIYTAIFVFCIIFAILTTLQVLLAFYRIRHKAVHERLSFIGKVFCTFLLISTVLLTIAYALHGAMYGVWYGNNSSQPPLPVNHPLYIAWHILEFFTDIFLVSGLLALIRGRQSFISDSLSLCGMVVDVVLVMAMFAVSISSVALGTRTSAIAENTTAAHHLYVAYSALFLLAVANVQISSIILYLSSRKWKKTSHCDASDSYSNMKIAKIISVWTSPLLIIHALYPLIWEGILASGRVVQDPSLAGVPSNHHIVTETQFDLGGLVIRCITELIVIEMCSRVAKKGE